MPSFDIVSEIDSHEVANAVDQTNREIGTRLGVDALGLDGADRRYLGLMAEHYGGGPVGIETLSAALSESRDALEEVIEPFLLQQGLIQRTPRGRMLAARAWMAHAGEPPALARPNSPAEPRSPGPMMVPSILVSSRQFEPGPQLASPSSKWSPPSRWARMA